MITAIIVIIYLALCVWIGRMVSFKHGPVHMAVMSLVSLLFTPIVTLIIWAVYYRRYWFGSMDYYWYRRGLTKYRHLNI